MSKLKKFFSKKVDREFIESINLFSRADKDLIPDIKDTYYYRIANTTAKPLEIKIDTQGKKTKFEFPPKPIVKGDPNNVRVFSGLVLNAFYEKFKDRFYDGSISIQPLDIEVNINYRITNRTARRIGIENYDEGRGDLIIPPFGSRSINSELLRWFKFLEWHRQDLIKLEREDQASKGPGSLSKIWDWIKLLPGILLVALAGFGIPLWIVFHFGGGNELIKSFITGEMFSANQHGLALAGLGRLFQVGFICVASILPALFYYLFGRQQVEKLREKFFHDILVLDPHLYTWSEAETKYDSLLSSAYGSGSSNSPFAILLLIFSTVLLVTGWTLTLAPYGAVPQSANSLVDFFVISPSPLALGFLGVYFFSVNMVFRRYVRADLTPKTYAYITVRLLVSLVLVWSISVLPEFSSASLVENGLLPLAFIIGVFPEDGFRVIRDSVRKLFGSRFGGVEEKYPLTDLEGMNQYDQARLLEEGIENIENLAHHNLIELLAYTRIPTARLVDMFDQAILYLHLGISDVSQSVSLQRNGKNTQDQQDAEQPAENQDTQKGNPNSGRDLLQFLKLHGVRTATDLIKIVEYEDKNVAKEIIDASNFKRLRTIRTAFADDEWLSYILNWRRESSKAQAIRASYVNNPFEFYGTGSQNKIKEISKSVESADSSH